MLLDHAGARSRQVYWSTLGRFHHSHTLGSWRISLWCVLMLFAFNSFVRVVELALAKDCGRNIGTVGVIVSSLGGKGKMPLEYVKRIQ